MSSSSSTNSGSNTETPVDVKLDARNERLSILRKTNEEVLRRKLKLEATEA